MAEAIENPALADHENSTEEDNDSFEDVRVARDGINMLLNNQFDEALKLFQAHKYVSTTIEI